jgi:hypothetical protein
MPSTKPYSGVLGQVDDHGQVVLFAAEPFAAP